MTQTRIRRKRKRGTERTGGDAYDGVGGEGGSQIAQGLRGQVHEEDDEAEVEDGVVVAAEARHEVGDEPHEEEGERGEDRDRGPTEEVGGGGVCPRVHLPEEDGEVEGEVQADLRGFRGGKSAVRASSMNI